MREFRYNEAKNLKLIEERGVGFEELIAEINEDNFNQSIAHPNQVKYYGQKLMYIEYSGYTYVVPYIKEDDGTIFLKTLYPSRKAKKLSSKGKL